MSIFTHYLFLSSFFLEVFLFEVEQVDFPGGAGEGGVEPAEVLFVEHLVGDVTLLDYHRIPLATLCLVAGEGVGKLDLQGVVVGVLTHGSVAVGS